MTAPNRVAFTILGKEIYWYGVLMAVGIVLAVLLAMSEAKRKRLYKDAVLDLCLLMIPLGIIGARLYYVLFELDYYLANPIEILYVWNGGLAIYGAVLFGLLGAWIFSKIKKIRFLTLADVVAPGLALAQAIGRWGNFFNQEAYGPAVTNPSLLWFPFAVNIEGVHYFNNAICNCEYNAHMATFFYESMWCLVIFLVIWAMRKKRFKHDGDALLTYALFYSFERMFLEALRGDSLWLIKPDVWGLVPSGIRVSQLLSAVIFVGLVAFLAIRHARERKLGRLIWPKPIEAVPADAAAGGSAAESAGEKKADADGAKDAKDEAPSENPPENETEHRD